MIVTFCGSDMCGKTHIAHELSRLTGAHVYKANDEHKNFLDKTTRFKMNLLYADPARLDMIKQFKLDVLFDRGYPCEYVYSRIRGRESDDRLIQWLDEQYAALGNVIVHCTRKSFDGIKDDLDPTLTGEKLAEISASYDEYLATSKCRVLKLYVDDEDIEREVKEIAQFMCKGTRELPCGQSLYRSNFCSKLCYNTSSNSL